jgi:hypothetical protein
VAIGTVTVKDYDEGDELNVTLLENADGRLNLKPPRCSSVAVGFKNNFHSLLKLKGYGLYKLFF